MLLSVLLLAGVVSAAADTPTLIAPYLRARDDGRTGSVTGEVLVEPTRVSASPTPQSNVSVMLVPAEPDLDAELARIRAGYRDNARAFLAAAGRVREAREAYERDLAFAGGGELSLGEVTDAAGRFRFTGVPAGAWLLLAWRETPQPIAGRHMPGRDLGFFVGNTQIKGHTVVDYWRLAVEVRPGGASAVRLHDRNVWLSVVQEDRMTPASRADSVDAGRGSKHRPGTPR
jgi:hypothetical protein